MEIVLIPTPALKYETTKSSRDMLKAISAPLSHIRFLVVGGIDEKNIPEYRKAGARGFGIGSAIVNAKALAQCDAAQLMSLAKKYVETIEKLN